ncbi:unnamed protein product [Clonostachys rosea]|uniref:Uncharacterized protein n=1 Tax=Bionectria ochroleuca TaxID=29856 RepID=A0ABY6UYI2_BIOOC|nr:unnamed protein product [Clonostachys rosea]
MIDECNNLALAAVQEEYKELNRHVGKEVSKKVRWEDFKGPAIETSLDRVVAQRDKTSHRLLAKHATSDQDCAKIFKAPGMIGNDADDAYIFGLYMSEVMLYDETDLNCKMRKLVAMKSIGFFEELFDKSYVVTSFKKASRPVAACQQRAGD